MNTLELTGIVAAGSLVAGAFGALTGLGGGVIIVPLLTLALGIDVRYAMGASLVSIIATSSASAAAYVREGFTNIRVGLFLEVATTLGALVGASLVALLPAAVIELVFGIVLLVSVVLTWTAREHPGTELPGDGLAERLKLTGSFPTRRGWAHYRARHVPWAFGIMGLAGALSGLLGIGAGAMKVLAMDRVMRLPFKVSTTTSNFMIGVTAAASAGVYLRNGFIDPGLTMPVMLGVVAGSLLGTRVLFAVRSRTLRLLFVLAILYLGIHMIYRAVGRLP